MSARKDLSRYRRRRRQLNELQERRCYLCIRRWGRRQAWWPTADHVVPRALGGGWSGNVLLAHSECNHKKGDRAPHPCELLYLAAVNERLASLGGAA